MTRTPSRLRAAAAVLALLGGLLGATAGAAPASAVGVSQDPIVPGLPDLPVLVPEQVQGVTATAGDGSATVSWQAPVLPLLVSSYTVTVAPGGRTVTVAGGSTTSAVVGELRNGTAYTFTVAATNLLGTGPASAPAGPVTPAASAALPARVQGVTASAGDSSASVAWTAPAAAAGITSSTVTASPGGATTVVTGGDTASAVVRGLSNGTAYTFTVTATNAVGSGPASAPSNLVTPRAAPLLPVPAVTDVTATAGDGTATLTWERPALPLGLAYRVTVVGTERTVDVADPLATGAVVDGLTNGRPYSFTVTTTRFDGATSEPTAPTAVVVPAGLPFAPTEVGASRGDGRLSVTWRPAVANGSTITGYTVAVGDVERTVSGSTSSLDVTGLRNGTAYAVTVRATNGVGTGPASSARTATPAALPGRVAKPTATVSRRTVVLRWRAAAGNGSAVTGYRVAGGPKVRSVGGGVRTLRLTGLKPGRYAFTVSARSAVGTGTASAPVRVRVRR